MNEANKPTSSEMATALIDFNNRLGRIRRFTLYRRASRGRLRTVAQETFGKLSRTRAGRPTQEQIDALVNSLRFFIQDNEPTSLANIAEVYASVPLPVEVKTSFARCRRRLNGWLDGKSALGMDGVPLTHRQILGAFVYGDIAHQNNTKRQQFERWRSCPLSFPLFETQFVNILARLLCFLREVETLNKKALKHFAADRQV